MIFKKGYCEKGWAALIMLTFGFYSCVGNFISVELMRSEIEINSLCKNFEISCCRFYG
jgi:hypothetical protein